MIRLPFVSRGRYEDMVKYCDQWHDAFDRLGELYHARVDELVRMRKEGYAPAFDPKEYIDQPPTVDEQDAIHAQEMAND